MVRIDQAMQNIRNLRPSSFTVTELDDELQSMAMIRALPADYQSFRSSLIGQSTPITLTQQELLAVSVDLRKRFKDHTTAKRVPVVSTTVNEAWFHQSEDNLQKTQAAVHSVPLRAVQGLLDGKMEVECVVDNGSSIVALRKDIWEKLGTPLRSDLVMNMESSHSTVETTTGVLQDFPLQVGSSKFYLQIQVADNLPCELLLGKPFFMHTKAITMDHEDGSQELVLRNSNTGEEIMVATHERKKKAVKQDF